MHWNRSCAGKLELIPKPQQRRHPIQSKPESSSVVYKHDQDQILINRTRLKSTDRNVAITTDIDTDSNELVKKY